MNFSERYRKVFLITGLLMAGCLEPYQPPVSSEDVSYLVVDGFINSTEGSATVSLSRTIPLASNEPAPAVTNATVIIEDEQGNSYTLPESSSGLYKISGLNVTTERNYRLRIRTSTHQEYLSDYTPIKKSPPIDSVFWVATSDGVNINVNTHDVAGSSRYYRWDYTETWEYRSIHQSVLKLVNGQVVDRPASEMIHLCWRTQPLKKILVNSTGKLREDVVSNFTLVFIPKGNIKISRKYSIQVQQHVLTEEAYDYWLNLQKNTESLGGLFDPMPSQLDGNIHAVTNPAEPVIGYFSGGSVETTRIFVSNQELPREIAYIPPPNCPIDTILSTDIKDYDDSFLIISTLYGERGNFIGYSSSNFTCIDCRLWGGVTTKPDFWE